MLKHLKNFWSGIKKYAKRNPAKMYSYAAMLAVYVVKKFPEFPPELVIAIIMGFLGIGDQVQKIEDTKTQEALYTLPPE
jgi:hypothetical protein